MLLRQWRRFRSSLLQMLEEAGATAALAVAALATKLGVVVHGLGGYLLSLYTATQACKFSVTVEIWGSLRRCLSLNLEAISFPPGQTSLLETSTTLQWNLYHLSPAPLAQAPAAPKFPLMTASTSPG